jgi:uncharacterized Rmd1/YagE family protein
MKPTGIAPKQENFYTTTRNYFGVSDRRQVLKFPMKIVLPFFILRLVGSQASRPFS